MSRTAARAVDDPARVCAVLGPLLTEARRARIDACVGARLGGLRLVLENLHDPHNGAAVLRSSEAFGLQHVHVVEQAEPFRASPTITQGCDKWLDVHRHRSLAAALAALRAEGLRLYATVPGTATTVDDIDWSTPSAILLGNEHDGLSEEAVAAADGRLGIPMAGMTQSLNLSVSAAIVAGAAAARRRQALGAPGDLDEPAQLALRARFYALDVRGAEAILRRSAS